MTRMIIYVQPSFYGDSTLSHAIDKYATEVEHNLGWVVTKKSLDEYTNWRSIRTRIMNDDPTVVLLAGDKIDYPTFGDTAGSNYFTPSLAPFYSDKEPYLVDEKVAIRVNYYKVDRAVSILQADKQSLVQAFNKFKQIKVGEYKNVRIFNDCGERCTKEHYSVPAKYNYNYCECCDQVAIDTALTEELTLLGGRGHGSPQNSACGKGYDGIHVLTLKDVKLLMLFISGCNTNSWIKGMDWWFGHLVVTNPYLQFFLGGGYGVPCGNISGVVLPRMLSGKTYPEAVIGVTIDQFHTAYGNPAFCLSDGEPSPPTKSYIDCSTDPNGAGIWLKKH